MLHLPSRRTYMAGVRQVVGRSRKSDLHIPNRRVSAEHAILAWSGYEWVLRDLGSTNGTYVDGRRLPVGDRTRLRRNALIAFGDVEDAWRLVSDSPPLPKILDMATGEFIEQSGPILGIPSAEQPTVTIYWSKSGWVRDDGETQDALVDDTVVVTDGQSFKVLFPEDLAGTIADTDLDHLIPTPTGSGSSSPAMAMVASPWMQKAAPAPATGLRTPREPVVARRTAGRDCRWQG